MFSKWLFQVVIFVLLFAGSVFGVSAQDREDVRPFVRVTIGARSDSYIYYTPDNPDYNRILDVLDAAIPIYSKMTGLPWSTQTVIVFMDSDLTNRYVLGRMLENSTAYVTRKETQRLYPDAESCHLRIFKGWESAPNLESVVAREFFHCVQMSIGAVGIIDFAEPSNAWWLLGSAEWAASRVYPSQYPQIVHSVFDPRQDITTARLDAFYFWEFLASARGFGNDQNVITQMGTMRQGGLFPLNFGNTPTQLFQNWAQVLLTRQLPIPPTVDLTKSNVTAGAAGTQTPSMPRFAVDYKNLVSFDMKAGNIAFVQVSDLSSGNYAVSVQTSSGIERLVEGTPFQFCPSDEGTMLIISRGRGDIGSSVPFTLEWGQVPSPTPCTPTPPPAASTGACIVGSWLVMDYPNNMSALFKETDISGFIFTFNEDGAFDGTYSIHGKNPDGMKMDIEVPFSGNYELSGIEGKSTEYVVQTFNWALQPGGSASMTARNGKVNDLTEAFYQNSDTKIWSPDGSLNCDGDVLTWNAAGVAEDFVMQRLP